MNGLLLLIILSGGRFFTSFDIFENLSTASFMYQQDTSNLSFNISSFSKNDELIGRRIRQMSFFLSTVHNLRSSVLKFYLNGSDRKENRSTAQELQFSVSSSTPILKNLNLANDVTFDVQQLGGAVYTADNSGVSINTDIDWQTDGGSAELYLRMDNRKLIQRRLHGLKFSARFARTIHLDGRAEYDINSYELAGTRDTEFRKGGEFTSKFNRGLTTISINANAWKYHYLKTSTRNRMETSIDFSLNSQLNLGESRANIELSNSISRNDLPSISLWERELDRHISVKYFYQHFEGKFRVSLKRYYYPPMKPDDRDERLIESSVSLNNYSMMSGLLDIELGVRQNDFLFVRSERSANTRKRRIFFVRTGYQYDGVLHVDASNELAAFYTLYRFDAANDMLLRYIDLNVDISKKFSITELNLSLRHKLSDYGRFFENVYYRRAISREYWMKGRILIGKLDGFNLNLHMENYIRSERVGKYKESRAGFELSNNTVRLGLTSVRRTDRHYLTFSLTFERGF